jgi:hypothetical protein
MRNAVVTIFLIWMVFGEGVAIYSIAKMNELKGRRFFSVSMSFIICAPIIFSVEMVLGLLNWPIKALWDTRQCLVRSEFRHTVRQTVERQTKQL